MVWLAWRQHRAQVLTMAAVLAGVAGYLVYQVLPFVESARVMRACDRGAAPESACWESLTEHVGVHSGLDLTLAAVNLLPALVGAFWGAPLLAREFERGTHRLVWGQGVTRLRWLTTKLIGLAAAALAGGAVQAVAVNWVIDQFLVTLSPNRFQDRTLFSITGVVPPALWLFMLMAGVAVGLLVRRTLPAMAVTLAVFGMTMLGLNAARTHYDTPTVATDDSQGATLTPTEEWNLGPRIRRSDGSLAPVSVGEALCRPSPQVEWDPYVACLAGHDMEQVTLHHPASRYWPFQWIEAGILLAGAACLATVLLVRVRRRPD
jgi:ABC-2 family transporter protein